MSVKIVQACIEHLKPRQKRGVHSKVGPVVSARIAGSPGIAEYREQQEEGQ